MKVKQEILREQGFAIQADEEQLRVQLETLQVELNHPTQFKVRQCHNLIIIGDSKTRNITGARFCHTGL